MTFEHMSNAAEREVVELHKRIAELEAEVERLKEHAAEMRRRKIEWTKRAEAAEAALEKVKPEMELR